jgi:hypothetical protein
MSGNEDAQGSRKRIIKKQRKRGAKNSPLKVVDGQHRVDCYRRFQFWINETPEELIEMPLALRKQLTTRRVCAVAKS